MATKASTRRLALAGALLLTAAGGAHAQGGFLGFGGDEQIPTLHIAPAQIDIDVPMPVDSAKLALLLAGKGDLSSMKDAALRKHHQHLQRELSARLRDFFADEEVPLVDGQGVLNLHNRLDVKVVKRLSELQTEGDYDLESGTVELDGSFYFQLRNRAGAVLLEQSVDISNLRVREKYQVKSLHGGAAVEDSTESAIQQALTDMVVKILKRIDGDLEADELQDLAFDD